MENGGSCFSKTDRDFDGSDTTTTYCEVCELSDRNKIPLQFKNCSGLTDTSCKLMKHPIHSYNPFCDHDDEDSHPLWMFTSYDDNSLCDCGAPFIYHSRAIHPGSRTNRSDFLEWKNLNDFFARPLEAKEKECFSSHGEYKNQPVMCENSVKPYPDPDKTYAWKNMKKWRFFTAWAEYPFETLPSIPGSQCRSRPDISSLFSLPQSPYYPEKCDAGWFQVGNVCFKQFTDSKSWPEARQICKENSAELASIPDEETQSMVWSEIEYQTPGLFWTGGFKNLFDDEWEWSDGEYWYKKGENWAQNEPEADRGNCLAMLSSSGGKWGAVGCSERLSFVCSRNLQIIF